MKSSAVLLFIVSAIGAVRAPEHIPPPLRRVENSPDLNLVFPIDRNNIDRFLAMVREAAATNGDSFIVVTALERRASQYQARSEIGFRLYQSETRALADLLFQQFGMFQQFIRQPIDLSVIPEDACSYLSCNLSGIFSLTNLLLVVYRALNPQARSMILRRHSSEDLLR